jgi:hypothetical protein
MWFLSTASIVDMSLRAPQRSVVEIGLREVVDEGAARFSTVRIAMSRAQASKVVCVPIEGGAESPARTAGNNLDPWTKICASSVRI